MEEVVEQTIHICREVNLYRIPPRHGADGYRSGDWKVADKIFSGRLRVKTRGADVQLCIEDVNSGDLFAMCPFEPSARSVAVEPVLDSSRYFVIRVVDPATKRHAYLGLGFNERGDAFDFNAALSDHEKQLQRSKALDTSGPAPSNISAEVKEEVALLYKPHSDLSLKEGQTIKVTVKKPAGSGTSSLSSRVPVPLVPLPPAPGHSKSIPGEAAPQLPALHQPNAPYAAPVLAPPQAAPQSGAAFAAFTTPSTNPLQQQPHPSTAAQWGDDPFAIFGDAPAFQQPAAAPAQPSAPGTAAPPPATTTSAWVTF